MYSCFIVSPCNTIVVSNILFYKQLKRLIKKKKKHSAPAFPGIEPSRCSCGRDSPLVGQQCLEAERAGLSNGQGSGFCDATLPTVLNVLEGAGVFGDSSASTSAANCPAQGWSDLMVWRTKLGLPQYQREGVIIHEVFARCGIKYDITENMKIFGKLKGIYFQQWRPPLPALLVNRSKMMFVAT